MNRAIRIVALLAVGTFLAYAVTWVVGWLAAITFTPEATRSLARSAFLANAVYVFGMAALPAAALAFVFGFFAARALSVSQVPLVALCSLPWLAFVFFTAVVLPFPQEAGIVERLQPMAFWSFWPGVLAVPLGLWLAAKVQIPRSLPNAA